MPKNKNILSMDIGKKKIPGDDLVLLCSQFEAILKSGAQVPTCVKLIARQTKNKKLKEILEAVQIDVEAGRELSKAFEKRAGDCIPATFFETLKAGEHSGDLKKSFETLKEYFKKQSKISKQIKSALIYPVFIVAVAVCVLIVVMAYVMPQMTAIFNNMGGDIPAITKVLISISDFFSVNVAFIIAGIILAVVLLKLYAGSKKGRIKVDRFKLKLPVFGRIALANNCALFATTLSMLLESGLVMTRALLILSRVFENAIFKNAAQALFYDIEGGRSLGASMRKKECFPDTLCEMCAIGESTGELNYMLKTTGDFYQDEAENATKNLLAKLEPALLVVIAAFAGFIVFAIYIPLFEMYDLF